jgi:aldose 1-epimerase
LEIIIDNKLTDMTQQIDVIKLYNANNLELQISTLGATILSLEVPDKNKKPINTIVGLSCADDYQSDSYLKTGLYLGTTVGRSAGRISKGQFTIGSKSYPIYTINGVHLHGGKEGFDKKIWTIEAIEDGESPSVTLSYISKHLEEGYPGNLKVFATYTLTNKNALIISYEATTDQTTIINLTNHSYFNLNGNGSILDHELQINSDFYLDMDENLIPTGKINPVKGSRFDYNEKSLIGKDSFKGLDDIFILKESKQKAVIASNTSGIRMKVYSNQPAMIIYTPLKFQELPFKDGANYSDFPAICFETQHYPDAPNNEHFPSTILKPDQTYLNESIFEFSNI